MGVLGAQGKISGWKTKLNDDSQDIVQHGESTVGQVINEGSTDRKAMREQQSKLKLKLQIKNSAKKTSTRKLQAYTEANYVSVVNSSQRKSKENTVQKKVG